MVLILLDTNFFIGLIFPNDNKFNESNSVIKYLIKENFEIIVPELVRKEINNVVRQIRSHGQRILKNIFYDLRDKNIKEFNIEAMDIIDKTISKEISQQLLFSHGNPGARINEITRIEIILSRFIENRSRKLNKDKKNQNFVPINDLRFLFQKFRRTEQIMIDLLSNKSFDQLNCRFVKNVDKNNTLVNKLKNLIPNFNDRIIVITFLEYLNEANEHGFILSSDYLDILSQRDILEQMFPNLSICRPKYLRFRLEMLNKKQI